jgi:hypothetical protein
MGFSQGAALAGAVASMLEKGTKQDVLPTIEHPPFDFFISVSGFRLWFDTYDPLYPIHTPSMHVIGAFVPPLLQSFCQGG